MKRSKHCRVHKQMTIEVEDSVSQLEKPWESLTIRINQAGDRVPEFEDKVEDLHKLNKENGRIKIHMVRSWREINKIC